MKSRSVKLRSPFFHSIEYVEGGENIVKPVTRMASVSNSLRALAKRGVREVTVRINMAKSDQLCMNSTVTFCGHPDDIREHIKHPFRGL